MTREDSVTSETRKSSPTRAANGACAGAHDGEPPLGRVLFRVSRALFFEDKPLPEMDALPLAQLRLFWSVHFCPDGTMKDFSERLKVSQSTVTQLADRLVKRGLVERVDDPNDRRIVRLHISSAGQKIVAQAEAQRRHNLCAVWNTLTEEDQDEIMRGLEILAQRAEQVREAEGRPLSPLPDKIAQPATSAAPSDSDQPQPVLDLMSRRVRGHAMVTEQE